MKNTIDAEGVLRMIHARAVLPEEPRAGPTFVLVHGAANSARVWTFWQRELAARGRATYAPDVRGHGDCPSIDLSDTSMADYAADVERLIHQLPQPPVLIGWSMGGLVAMMLAARGLACACITLAPSMPAQRVDPSVELRTGEFGPEEYGIAHRELHDQPSMPDLDPEEREIALASLGQESRLARDERQRGIVIEALPCPLLVATGTLDTQWPRQRYDGLWLPAEYLIVEGASHWGLVLNRRALERTIPAVLDWLEKATRTDSSL